MVVDYLIIGAGLTGATIARLLADAGREVLVLERRPHVGGNVYDFTHKSGIRIHSYGPHYFRTSSQRIWDFVSRFDSFWPFEAVVRTSVNGSLVHWPVTTEYIRTLVADDWQPSFVGQPSNFEEASLSLMPRVIYESLVKGYTEKQWGVPATALSATLAKRLRIRKNGDHRLSTHRWQGVPTGGYTHFMQELLRGIPVLLDSVFEARNSQFTVRKCMVYTGPIDEFFNYDLGHLCYRAQRREHHYYPNQKFQQPVVQVNNPDRLAGPYIRIIEWKHLLPPDIADRIEGTVVTLEIPFTPDSPDAYEYPFPDDRNRRLYQLYRKRAAMVPRTVIAGRLGEYRYYDMDQAIARALLIGRRLLGSG